MLSQQTTLTAGRHSPRWGVMAWIPVLLAMAMPAAIGRAQLRVVSSQVQPATGQATGTAAADQRKTLQADAAHLLQLATELKANVDRTRKDELSVQVIREADEIEKLARSARTLIR